jgi:predicted metal-dependent hydrolase
VRFQFFHKQRPSKDESLVIGETTVPLLFVVNHRARRYILRLRPDGTARVTIPRRGSWRAAREFAQRNVHWLNDQLRRLAAKPVRDPGWTVGSEILFRGQAVRIVSGLDPNAVTFADQTVPFASASRRDLRPAIERHLRSLAAVELPPKVLQYARQYALLVQRVCVRNQKSRWGSCSRRGTISLNWRLIQTPSFVSDYIVLHELMHLREMNHSPKFWREVERVCPAFREAESWLKQNTTLLR